MENRHRVDQHSGAVVYPPDSPEILAKRRQKRQMEELLTTMQFIRKEVSELKQEVSSLKEIILAKHNSN